MSGDAERIQAAGRGDERIATLSATRGATRNRVTTRRRRHAPGRIRTCDTRFRKPVLYPLSYGGP